MGIIGIMKITRLRIVDHQDGSWMSPADALKEGNRSFAIGEKERTNIFQRDTYT